MCKTPKICHPQLRLGSRRGLRALASPFRPNKLNSNVNESNVHQQPFYLAFILQTIGALASPKVLNSESSATTVVHHMIAGSITAKTEVFIVSQLVSLDIDLLVVAIANIC